MSTVTPQTQYTPEDLLRMPDGDRYELVNGQLVERNTSLWSSYVGGQAYRRLGNYAFEHRSGWVLPEGTPYQCFPNEPNKVRKADVSFIRLERLTLAQATEEGHVPIAPDLAVEVMSPNDLAYDVDEKVQDYRRAGVALVWVVNPRTRTVEVHRRDGVGTILGENDELSGENVIPGFRCRVGDLFIPPSEPEAATPPSSPR